jgi:predicted cupin superfamily sugar epimerase
MSNIDKSIRIAMDTFFAGYDGDPVEIYNRLKNETHSDWYSIEYASVWSYFEREEVADVMSYVENLADSIIRNFGE